jgi:hypothetical protein
MSGFAGGADGVIVGDEVDFCVGSFEQHLCVARGVVEDVAEDPTFEMADAPGRCELKREAFVGKDCPASGEHLLTVGCALHRSKGGFEVLSHVPLQAGGGFGESHRMEDSYALREQGVGRWYRGDEVIGDVGSIVAGDVLTSEEQIQGGRAGLIDFALARFGSVRFRPVAELGGAEILGVPA